MTSRNYTGCSSRRSSLASRVLALAVAAGAFVPLSTRAQEPARTPADSLAARLERAEEAIELLKQQLAEQARSGVQTRSRVAFELHGTAMINVFSNSGRGSMLDVPITASPALSDGLPRGSMGISIRQSMLGFSVTAPEVLGADFAGDLDVDFFGGQYDGTTAPLLRLRTMRAWLKWKHAELMVGQDVPLMSPLNPLTLAAPAMTGFAASGNLWAWLPQLRFGVERGREVKVGLTGALLAPNSTGSATGASTDGDVAQRTRRPFVEGRAHVRWGAEDLAGELGLGTHAGWYAVANSPTRLRSTGVGVDALVPLTARIELRGEWYSGDGMQGLGGGAISQLFSTTGQLIHSTGMWGQLNLKPSMRLTLGGGVGVDDPQNDQMAANARLKNVVSELHAHVRPAGPLVLGFEYRRISTSYATQTARNDHLNVAVGFVF